LAVADFLAEFSVKRFEAACVSEERFESMLFGGGLGWTEFEFAFDDGERVCGYACVEGGVALELFHGDVAQELFSSADEFRAGGLVVHWRIPIGSTAA
jgi:hypothetical protein